MPKQLYFEIPEEVHRQLKVEAAQREMYLKDLLNKILASFAEDSQKKFVRT